MTELTKNILKLRAEGKSFRSIKKELNCSLSTISYHCSEGQKEKNKNRNRKRIKKHPYIKKLEAFIYKKNKNNQNKNIYSVKTLLREKVCHFCTNYKTKMKETPEFTYQDVIEKFGENPVCYLTGEIIDIYQPSTYQFDHIIPASRGGQNTLDNLGICIKQANQSKRDMTPEEYVELCRKIVKHADRT